MSQPRNIFENLVNLVLAPQLAPEAAYIVVKLRQLLNIEPIVVTLEISQLLTSRLNAVPEQPPNILVILVTLAVFQLLKSGLNIAPKQSLNIELIVVTLEVSQLLTLGLNAIP